MAQVNVAINGHQYRMACLDGQEDHLMQLAQGLNRRIEELRAKFGEVGDMRLIIMAAIMVADELFEATGKIRRLEHDVTSGEEARLVAAQRAQVTEAAVAAAFASAAERIETVARHLARDPAAARDSAA
jgi:cell division protein ZapA